MKMAKSLQEYFELNEHYFDEINALRDMFLGLNLQEELKWGSPSYLYKGKLLFGIASFKAHYGVWFFQGGLLKDDHKKLVNAQEGKTVAMRQWRMENMDDLISNKRLIEEYILESCKNVDLGLEIKPKRNKPLIVPEELQLELKNSINLEKAFESLNLTKKRDFCQYISDAKRSGTKLKRLEKIKPMILEGVGLNDKYSKK